MSTLSQPQHLLKRLAGGLALAAGVAALSPAAAMAHTTAEASALIRNLEQTSFSPPTPSATFTVGTFNAGTGTFSGTVTKEACKYDPEFREVVCEPGPPPRVTVNGVHAGFTIRWNSSSGTVKVNVNGRSKTSTAAAGQLTVDAGRAREIDWSIEANGRRYADQLVAERPRVVGAGVFTIKALPIGIAYEPPQDPDRLNNNKYTRVTTTATTISSTFQTTNSTTVPQATSRNRFIDLVKTAGAAAASSSDPDLKAGGQALQQIATIIGDTQRDVTTEHTSGSTTSIDVQVVQGRECTTGDHLGPGGGDKIVYLKNARMVWLDNGSQTVLMLLGSDAGASCVSVQALKDGTSVFDAETEQVLLSVDPLVANPNLTLPNSRYTKVAEIDLDHTTTANPDADWHTESRWESIGTTSLAKKVTTDTMQAGLLSFLGVGPEQSQTVSTTVSTSNSRVEGDGTAVTTSATLRTLVKGQSTTLYVYYDKAFGTILYQRPPKDGGIVWDY